MFVAESSAAELTGNLHEGAYLTVRFFSRFAAGRMWRED